MLTKLWHLLSRPLQTLVPGRKAADPDISWMFPPDDLLDIKGWDQYWIEHIKRGFGPMLFDMFCNDSTLIRVMNDEGMKKVLCAGNGISQEPKALAAAGMHVVALDISPQAVEIAKNYPFPQGAISHYIEPWQQTSGGSALFVTGNIFDSTICHGPFDVIIERRTAQNYSAQGKNTFLNSLADRLDDNGILISHCHDGKWKPPALPVHHCKSWFEEMGRTIWNTETGQKPSGKVAWLSISTG
jgi:2-polyprenyl-3-methyl-5-hydroxy-6-metoxy-1,4-benzoquinol methylase